MKRAYLGKPLYLIGSILVCIGVTFAYGNEAVTPDSTAPDSTTEDSRPVAKSDPGSPATKVARSRSYKNIPDSAEVRKTMIQTWFSASMEEVIKKEPEIYTDSKGNRFTVSGAYAENQKATYVISVIPITDSFRTETEKQMPKGAWALYRSTDTGAPLYIKFYPAETPVLSISLRPAPRKAYSGKTFIDVSLFHAYVCKDIAVGIPFERLYHIPLSRLRALTQAIIPWNLFVTSHYNNSVKSMSRIVEEHRHKFVFLKDGCFDHEGRPVHISNLEAQTDFEISSAMTSDQTRSEVRGGVGTAGFAKWVIDGIIRPVAGEGTVIRSLKRPTEVPDTHFTRTHRDREDPFSNLDWIRNLGAAALTLNLAHSVYPENSGLDVTVCPFALNNVVPSATVESSPENTSAFLGYQKYAGYQTSYLVPLLYYLAMTEPDHFYLACVNSVHTASAQRMYDKIAVFFPYFDSWGTFHLAVYEQGSPVKVEDFIKENTGTYTALVRVRAPEEGLFNP